MKLSKSKQTFGAAFSFASWWVCILGATYVPENAHALFFTIFGLASLLIHYLWVFKGHQLFWLGYLVSLILGLAIDTILFKLGFMRGVSEQSLYLPYWLIAMWVVFPLNFGHAFGKIITNLVFAIPFGVLGAPLAYKAGPSFKILALGENALFAIGFSWGIYMLIIYYLFKRLSYSTKRA